MTFISPWHPVPHVLMEAADSESKRLNELLSDGIKERLTRIEARAGSEVPRHRFAIKSEN